MEAARSYRRTSCLLCGSRDLELALPLLPSAIGNDYLPAAGVEQQSYSLNLFLCRACGNVQLEDVVDPELLFRSYTYSTASSLGLVEHFRNYARAMLERFAPAKGSLVLDIGSNDGSLLRAFGDEGMRVLGVDPAVELARAATTAGLETIPDFFSSRLAGEIRQSHGTAAVITANNVFAHSDQLPDMADGIRELLAPDGIFSFEVSYLVDIVQKMLFDTVYHEHLCYHTVRPLTALFRRHGLELIDVERIPTKGGSVRGTVQRAGGPRSPSAIVAGLCELEARVGLDTVAVFQTFAERIGKVKSDVRQLMDGLKAEGKVLAGYGASPTVTTLLFQFELAEYLKFLVDDNPIKQNTYSPGHKIPVYQSQRLYDDRIEYAVILAWNYAEPIMQRHQGFMQRGGRFVVPLPVVRVV